MSEAQAGVSLADEEPRVVAAVEQIASLLVPGETLLAYAVQRRLFALTHRRSLVAATSGRLIGMTRGLIAGYHPQSVRWQDLKDARLDVGVFGATLTIGFYTSPDLAVTGQMAALRVDGLRKEGAQEVYRLCQAQEQAWREKRRVRELEELRAKSGGIHLSGGAPALGGGAGPEDAADGDPVARLERAKAMLDKRLISDSEYEALKARIVNSL